MGLNKRRPKFMKLRRTMKAQSPKKRKKKEIIKKKEEDLGQRTCSKDLRQDQKTYSKDLGQARGYAARRINIKALCMFRFQAKKAIKNPTQSSERTGLGYPGAAKGSGSSGRPTQRGIETA